MVDDKLFAELSAKFDALTKRLEVLETPKAEVKTDANPLLAKSSVALKALLKGVFKQEKLDAMTLEELIIAASLKEDFQPPSPQFIDPPTGTKPKQDVSEIPEQMRAHMEDGSLI